MREVPLCLISPPAGKQLAEQLLGQASLLLTFCQVSFHLLNELSELAEQEKKKSAVFFGQIMQLRLDL